VQPLDNHTLAALTYVAPDWAGVGGGGEAAGGGGGAAGAEAAAASDAAEMAAAIAVDLGGSIGGGAAVGAAAAPQDLAAEEPEVRDVLHVALGEVREADAVDSGKEAGGTPQG